MFSHFTRRSDAALFYAVLVASALLVCIAGFSSAARVGHPFPSFVVWRNLVVPAISAPSWPDSAGDLPFRTIVTEVDGQPVRTSAELRRVLDATPPGTPLSYTFRRGGVSTSRTVPVVVLSWSDVLPTYLPYFLNGITLLTAGLVVFYLKPQHPAARAFLVLTGVLGGVLILAIDTLGSSWVPALYFTFESLLPAALLQFALSFPDERPRLRRHPSLRWWIYLAFTPLVFLQIGYFYSDPENHLLINDLVYGAVAATGLLVIASLIHTYASSTNAVARQQVLVVLLGMALAALPPSVGLIAIVLLGLDIPMNLLSPFYIVGPLAIGYAIGRHDLFGIDRFLRTGVVYGAISLIVFLGYVVTVELLRWIVGAEAVLPSTLVPLYLLALIILFNPLYSRTQLFVDRLFHRQTYDYRDAVDRVSKALASFLDADRIANTTLAALTETMSIEWATLLLLPEKAGRRASYSRPRAREHEWTELLRAESGTVRNICTNTRGIRVCDPSANQPTALFHGLGGRLLAPLVFEDRPLGLLLVGDKKSGALYSNEDLHLIETLANQTALAMNNAEAYTVLQRTQRELMEAERLAAIGELGAAVAHGIRNPLAGIRAAAQLALEDPDDSEAIAESLEDIIGEADRLETRIRSLLDFSRPFDTNVVAVDTRELLERLATQVERRIPDSIEFQIVQDERVRSIRCDVALTLEVLDELVTNALHAMQGGRGQLIVRSRLDSDNAEPPEALIEVSDTGPGLSKEQAERIFGLFFTTKEQGTGIGLATAKRMIERQGGRIEVSGEPGVGATFALRFPLTSDNAQPYPAHSPDTGAR